MKKVHVLYCTTIDSSRVLSVINPEVTDERAIEEIFNKIKEYEYEGYENLTPEEIKNEGLPSDDEIMKAARYVWFNHGHYYLNFNNEKIIEIATNVDIFN
jgi:hypothetical protein